MRRARDGAPVAELAAAADRLVDAEVRAGRPVYIDGGDLKSDDGQLRLIPVALLDLLLDDVRREQARAISEWRRTAPPGDIGDRVVENWRRTRPGFARLLDLTDQT